MPRPSLIKIARRFIEALSTGDSATVEALMTEDMVYTDGRGDRIVGRAACITAARTFHQIEPNYRFEVRQASVRGDVVLIRGVARADNPRLCGEALLRGRFRGSHLCEWQVDRHNPPPLATILSPVGGIGPEPA